MPVKLHPTFMAGALIVALGSVQPALAAPPSEEAQVKTLSDKIDMLANIVESLRNELHQLKAENEALKAQQAQTQKAVADEQQTQTTLAAKVQSTNQTVDTLQSKPNPLENLNLWGYGEIYDMNPIHRPQESQGDLARAVFGIGYQFDDKTHFNSEFEVEHTVASASDVGEFEVEQFYVDRQLTTSVGAQAGLFLIPAGLLNENHEPTNFYGVQRNFVETLIIPSTWREGGLNLHGNTDSGLRWTVGLTTAQDISKWNFTPEFVPYQTALDLENNDIGPLQASHQELSLASTQHLAQFVSVDYSGIAGLRVGGSVFTADVGRVLTFVPDDERATLWELHARYSPGKWQLSALYAQGTYSNTAEANEEYPGTANPIPAKFYGWYLEAGYNLWQSGDYRLSPFVRYERYNMGASYEGLAPGFGPRPSGPFPTGDASGNFSTYPYAADIVSTVGANFYVTPHLVFKTDVQHFSVNKDFSRVDFGMGLAFD
jgi:hypothetical protein